MTAAVVAASTSVVVAVLAFILNQFGNKRQEQRQARLTRVNSQLRDLYGPLNAMVDTNERIWEALRVAHVPSADKRTPEAGTADWRRWRDEALQPANRQMRDLILSHADLLVESTLPEPMRDLCAHVAAHEVVRSAEGAGIPERALIDHPGGVYVSHVRHTFAALKNEQVRLLRQPAWLSRS
jgi:hypothetical protein